MRLILGILGLMTALAHTAATEPITFAFGARVTGVSGAVHVVDRFAELGVVVDAPIRGEIIFDSSRPSSPDSAGFYDGAILQSQMRIGGWTVQGPTNASRINSINVSPTSYSVAVAVHDGPDVIPSDASTTVLYLAFHGADPPVFENTDLPVEAPDPSLFEIAFGRVLGGGGDAGRVQVVFDVETMVRVSDGLERIMGIQIRRRGVVFQVESSGCTGKADFQVEVFEGSVLQVALIRTQPDLCRAVEPLGTRIHFSYRELGFESAEKFIVINPRAPVRVPDRQVKSGARQRRRGN